MTGIIMALTLMQATVPVAAQSPQTPAPRAEGRSVLFVSPMGEPFRGAEPQYLWFDQADTNHDGVVTLAEFEADATRFFKTLDRQHDGEIDPDDIDYYETKVLPEVRVAFSETDAVEQSGTQSPTDQSDENHTPYVEYPDRQGAGRYSWFDYPEPITVCDTNYNRGVDADEFRQCADRRFAILDKNHDGVLRRDELPPYSPQAGPNGNRNGVGGRGRRGGHRSRNLR